MGTGSIHGICRDNNRSSVVYRYCVVAKKREKMIMDFTSFILGVGLTLALIYIGKEMIKNE